MTRFAPGDRVFGVNADRFGATRSSSQCVRTRPLATMPAGTAFEEAAPVCDGVILALTCLRKAGLGAGQRILVYGASGSIGTAAVQLAKVMDAGVTAVCDTRNVETVRALAADEVIDYTRRTSPRVARRTTSSSTRWARPRSGGAGAWSSAAGGSWRPTSASCGRTSRSSLLTRLARSGCQSCPDPGTRRPMCSSQRTDRGRAIRAVIDRRYRLEEIVEATRYVETRAEDPQRRTHGRVRAGLPIGTPTTSSRKPAGPGVGIGALRGGPHPLPVAVTSITEGREPNA